MSLIDWTPEDAKEWKRFWESHTGQKARIILQLACLPDGENAVIPGIDLKEIASQSDAFTRGQVNMITEKVDGLMPKPETQPLPPPFQKTPPPSKTKDHPPQK